MKNLPILVSILLLSACASTQNIAVSPDALTAMQGKTVTVIPSESPGFVAMTSGKGMFAVAGVGAAVAEGNKMVRESGIEDPALTISRALAAGLANDYGLQLAGESDVATSDGIDTLVALAVGSDYALEVATNGWSYIYDGFNFGDYYVGYSSKLRLVDVNSAQVVSSGVCAYDAKKAGKSPVSHEKLLADNAAYIKQELADAASLCIQDFAAELFSMSPQSVARHTP